MIKEKIVLAGITGIVILESIALLSGIDGIVLTSVISILAFTIGVRVPADKIFRGK